MKHDIEELDPAHDKPTGSWSDGVTLWIAENGDGADDGVYAYNPESGERLADREFELHESNRAPRGIWSDGETVWVSDSGQDKLFAYDLATGQRVEDREIELDPRNGQARGIWSDGHTIWVLDAGKDTLFAYDLATAALIAEYALHSNNEDPRGIWSDGVTLWISDHGAKRLFAYRLPKQEPEDGNEPLELVRVSDEEFKELSKASNNSPRGVWSDGEVMYVVDESDDRVYSYNMPDAIDARLQSLSLSGVDIGEFDGNRTDYGGAPAEGVTETTVEVAREQHLATVVIEPPDANENTDGHQVSLDGTEITVTVTSPGGSRTKTYRVTVQRPEVELQLAPTWTSIEWPGAEGVAIGDALRDGGLADTVLVIYHWDEATSTWPAFFPGLEDVPGLSSLSSLRHGATYWVAVCEAVSWTTERDGPSGGRTLGQ